MKKRKAKEEESIYFIKATLNDLFGRAGGKPHRTLAVPETFSLYGLAEAITNSFDFYFDHCFGFYNNIKRWTNSTEGYELFADIGEESRFKGVKRTKVNEAFDKIGIKWLFLFDYGDEWHFVAELIKVEPANEDVSYPLVIESTGDAPPQYGDPEDDEDGF
ncbi:MAG TPA: hypothetical protein VGK02_01435 [Candidatus Aquicultor sp.]|jgi:hypothetical protein